MLLRCIAYIAMEKGGTGWNWFVASNILKKKAEKDFRNYTGLPPGKRIDGDRHSYGCLGLSWPLTKPPTLGVAIAIYF